MRVHDFLDKTLGKAIPYGVYDMTNNQGWVSVGIDHDTARFAVDSIRRWWGEMGQDALSRGHGAADHRRRRGQQRYRDAAVEGGTAALGGRTRADGHRLPFPAGHQQMEQDRAPAVLPHHPELAWQAAGEPPERSST